MLPNFLSPFSCLYAGDVSPCHVACCVLCYGPYSPTQSVASCTVLCHAVSLWFSCRHHESMSCSLLQLVLSEAQLDLDSSQVAHVQDMIDNGTHSRLRQTLRPDQAWRLQVRQNWCAHCAQIV